MIHERCAACGFDGAAFDDPALLHALRALGPRWQTLLDDAGPELRRRPAPAVWSALEYAAHSRDITALHCFGVETALGGEEPVYPGIEADELIETAAASYGDEDPDAVVADLDAQATLLADLGAGVPAERWSLGITFGTDRSTVRQLLEHALHDSAHHLADVERGLKALRA